MKRRSDRLLFEVDLLIVWDTAQSDLPKLKAWLREILEEE